MKWLISKEEFQSGRRFKDFNKDDFNPPNKEGVVTLKKPDEKDPKNLIRKSFVIYEEDKLSKVIMDQTKFHLWGEPYTLGEKFKDKQKINYECFCGGYLDFYNRTLSSEGVNRLLYLKWIDEDKNKGIPASVQLIISNPPEGKNYSRSVEDFTKLYTSNPPAATAQIDPDPPPGPPPPPDA